MTQRRKRLPIYTASKIIELYVLDGVIKNQIAKMLGISAHTVSSYICYYEKSGLTKTDLLSLDKKTLIERVHPYGLYSYDHEKTKRLMALFPEYHKRLIMKDVCVVELWAEYLQKEPAGHKYSRFLYNYHKWCRSNK